MHSNTSLFIMKQNQKIRRNKCIPVFSYAKQPNFQTFGQAFAVKYRIVCDGITSFYVNARNDEG